MSPFPCLIPAAGAGLRARPSTESVPKAMLLVGGKPILQHSVELVRDQLAVTTIVVVTGYRGEIIQNYFKDGKWLNVDISYVENNELEKGLAWSIYKGKEYISENFLVLLGDEFYHKTNHSQLNDISLSGALATCGLIASHDPEQIMQNYAVEHTKDHISKLIEKPQHVDNEMMGVGTFILSPKIFPLIAKSYQPSRESIDFIGFLNDMSLKGHRINPCILQGKYVNVNNVKALEIANRLTQE